MEEEAIRQLREEIIKMNQQLIQQQQQLHAMYQRLQQLTGTEQNIKPTQKASATPSLEQLIGLRFIHLIGIIVLVIGFSIGVKYAIDKQLISEVARIGLAYGAGLILFLLSLRLREKYALFSAILFSGAMATLYFTTYAACAIYKMVPFAVAFGIMVLLTLFTAYQALRYNKKEIALLGLVGAYAIPFLISENTERADLFFLYITIINVGVVFLSIKKSWKVVGFLAQHISWILFIGWASIRSRTDMLLVGVLFLTAFFILFLFNATARKIHRDHTLSLVDAYHVLLNNIALYLGAIFIFSWSMNEETLAMVTLSLAGLTGLQAAGSYLLWKEERPLTYLMSCFSFFLLILFVGLQWDGLVVTFLWMGLAVLVFASGFFTHSVTVRMAAIVLMALTLLKLVMYDSLSFSTVQKVIAYVSLGILLLVISFVYQKYKGKIFQE